MHRMNYESNVRSAALPVENTGRRGDYLAEKRGSGSPRRNDEDLLGFRGSKFVSSSEIEKVRSVIVHLVI